MREILFRGKTYDGRLVEGCLICAPNYTCILEAEEKVHPMDYPYLDGELGTFDGKATPVIHETVGQYTGLTDKNGKRIFEGDIVQEVFGSRRTSSYYCVDMDEERCGWFPFACGDGCGCCENDVVSVGYCEVIGNIHDNPELLGGGEGG